MPGTGLSTPHTLNLDGLAQQKKTKLMQSLTCSRPCQYQMVEPELKLSLSTTGLRFLPAQHGASRKTVAQISVMVRGQAGEQEGCRAESGALCEPPNLCLVLTTPEHFPKKLSPSFLHYMFWVVFFFFLLVLFFVVVVDL